MAVDFACMTSPPEQTISQSFGDAMTRFDFMKQLSILRKLALAHGG
jgi:hypothetical protein